VPTRFIFYF